MFIFYDDFRIINNERENTLNSCFNNIIDPLQSTHSKKYRLRLLLLLLFITIKYTSRIVEFVAGNAVRDHLVTIYDQVSAYNTLK